MFEMNFTWGFSAFDTETALLMVDISEDYLMHNIEAALKTVKQHFPVLPELVFVCHNNGAWTQVKLNDAGEFASFCAPPEHYEKYFVQGKV